MGNEIIANNPRINIPLSRMVGTGLLPGRAPFNCGTCRYEDTLALNTALSRHFTSRDYDPLSITEIRNGSIYRYTPAYFLREESECLRYRIKQDDTGYIEGFPVVSDFLGRGGHYSVRDNKVMLFEPGANEPSRLLSWYFPHRESESAWEETKDFGWNMWRRSSYYRGLQRRTGIDGCNWVDMQLRSEQATHDYSVSQEMGSIIPILMRSIPGIAEVAPGDDGERRFSSAPPVWGKTIYDHHVDGNVYETGIDGYTPVTATFMLDGTEESLLAAIENSLLYSYSGMRIAGDPSGQVRMELDAQLPVVYSTRRYGDFEEPMRVDRNNMPTQSITEDMRSTYESLLESGYETGFFPESLAVQLTGNTRKRINIAIDNVGKGLGPDKFIEWARQLDRWCGGMNVFLDKLDEFLAHPSAVTSRYFYHALQAFLWYPHGFFDTILTVMPLAFWAGTFTEIGAIPLITGILYPLGFSLYLLGTLNTYFKSGKAMGMSFMDLIDKEAGMKIMAPVFSRAFINALKIRLGCGIDPGFIITGLEKSKPGEKTPDAVERAYIEGNAWRLAVNLASFSYGAIFLTQALTQTSHIASALELASYGFNTVFPLLDSYLRGRGINRCLATFDESGNRISGFRNFMSDLGFYAKLRLGIGKEQPSE